MRIRILKLLQKKSAIFAVLPAFIFLSFGFFHLTNFVSPDEQLWKYERIPHYWKGISSGEFEKTYINDKPGITLALIDGAGYFLNRNFNQFPRETTVSGDSESFGEAREKSTIKRNFFFRIPLLIWSALSLLSFYWITNKLTGNKPFSFLAVFIMSLSPILVGISQVINPDALIWSCTFASVLLFLAFIIKKEFPLSFLSGIFLGLSLLCKYTSTFLFIYFFSIILAWIFFFRKSSSDAELLGRDVKKLITGYVLTILTSVVVFAIFLPASLLDFSILLKGTLLYEGIPVFLICILALLIILILCVKIKASLFLKISNFLHKARFVISSVVYSVLAFIFLAVLLNWSIGGNFLQISEIPFDVKFFPEGTSFFEKVMLEFKIFVFSLQPVVIFLMLAHWIRSIFFKKNPFHFISFSLSFFILSFFGAVLSKNLFAIIRYDIILYPAAYFLAAISFYSMLSSAFVLKKGNKLILTVALVFSLALPIILAKPFYLNYTNNLLPKKYIIADSWGYGGFEAAKYLNSLPGAKELTVWSDYYGVCEFFSGTCTTNYSVNSTKNSIDYFVITRRGKMRYFEKLESNKKKNKDTLSAHYYYSESSLPEWELNIDNRPDNFIRIVPAETPAKE
ncbi:MAG: Uncharacterized protein Athens071425_541 [Parcubacteria group bacterium Athens0714_25]|nr:MAG: Uncharacterized protein Athens071425_541 [Parcubacteria group bacterium Athens0714_25]